MRVLAGQQNVGGYKDGVGEEALFSFPEGLVKNDGFLYVADYDNCAIRRVEIATRTVVTVAGDAGAYCASGDPKTPADGIGITAHLVNPRRLSLYGNELYFTDRVSSSINILRKLDLTTLKVTTVAGNGRESTDTLEGGWSASPAALDREVSLATPRETNHTATRYADYEFTFSQPGAKFMRVHFTKFDVGHDDEDKVVFKNAAGDELLRMAGSFGDDMWSPVVAVDEALTVSLFTSYASENYYGFKIDKIAYTTSSDVPLTHATDDRSDRARIGSVWGLTRVGDAFYIYDDSYNLVRKVDLTHGTVTALFGGPYDSTDPNLRDYATTSIGALDLTTDGAALFVADEFSRILRIDLLSRQVTSLLAHDFTRGAPRSADGPLSSADLTVPTAVLFDPTRGLFFSGGDSIRLIKQTLKKRQQGATSCWSPKPRCRRIRHALG